MTYETRQEVLRAAADWMDLCEKACVRAKFKFEGEIHDISLWKPAYDSDYLWKYEFPLALLEGKEVWVGSELWNVPNNFKFIANSTDFLCGRRRILDGKGKCGWIEDCSWNPPKPKTVMVEMLVEDAEAVAYGCKCQITDFQRKQNASNACKKALENLK